MPQTRAHSRNLTAATLLTALLLWAASASAQVETAQDRRSAAQELVRSIDGLMGPERLLASMRGTFQAQLEQQLKSASHLTLQQRDRAASVLSATMASTMGEWMQELMPGMYATMADIYVERFTLAEITEIRRFYESNVGRKSATVMQEDMPRLMAPMMQAMQARAPAIKARMDAAVQTLKAEGIVLQPDRP